MGVKANVLVGSVEITLGVGVSARVIGYTTDGVTFNVKSDFFDVKTDELSGTAKRVLTNTDVEVTFNMAEGTLQDMAAAIPGASLLSNTLTLGGGALQEHRLTLRGVTPAGLDRVIILKAVNPIGEVAIPYKKGAISILPITFGALIDDNGLFGEILDAVAGSPTLVVGASTKSNTAGTIIEAKFSKNMSSPVGKHLEFWFTEQDAGVRSFSAAALKGGDATTIELTVSGSPIVAGKTLALFYALGSVKSTDDGILRSFSNQTVVPRP